MATARAALQHTRAARPRVQLVWTGPLEAGAQTRSTLLTLQELIANAQQEIVIVGYTITDGAAPILASLAAARLRGIRVTIIANRIEQHREVIQRFWPTGAPGPTLFTYSQSSDDQMASLHAKAVIVDARRMLLTSANLTYHGLEGNIELGALIEDEIATSTVRLIQLLIERQIVVPVAI
jgi:phosphatidylserine/phosphatidylglycerophosphate/cardiolipin synthase-like enzyme